MAYHLNNCTIRDIFSAVIQVRAMLSGLFFYEYLLVLESEITDTTENIIVSGLVGATDGIASMATATKLTEAIRNNVEEHGYTSTQVANAGRLLSIKRV